MKPRKPHWEIARVKSLAAAGKLLLTKTKAQNSFAAATTATHAAMTIIAQLSERQFSETQVQLDICDVYAVPFQGRGWYLKVTVDDLLVVVSLHPLQWPLRTNGGVVATGQDAKDKPDEMP